MTHSWTDTLASRTKRMPGYSYKLAEDGRFGLDVLTADMEVDEKAMSAWIPFADGNRRDGVGDLLEVTGINCERHRKNPIVLFDHGKKVDLPVALAEDPQTKAYTVVIDPTFRNAKVQAFFYQGVKALPAVSRGDAYDHAVFCEQLFDLIAKRYVRAGSIGYQVVQAKHLYADPQRGTPQGLHLLSTLLLEASAVVMPANMDTVRKCLAMPAICGKRLSPYLVKSLQAYAPERKAQLGYEGKAKKPSIPIDPTKPAMQVAPYHTTVTGHPVPTDEAGQARVVYPDEPGFYASELVSIPRNVRDARLTANAYAENARLLTGDNLSYPVIDHTTDQRYHEQIVDDDEDMKSVKALRLKYRHKSKPAVHTNRRDMDEEGRPLPPVQHTYFNVYEDAEGRRQAVGNQWQQVRHAREMVRDDVERHDSQHYDHTRHTYQEPVVEDEDEKGLRKRYRKTSHGVRSQKGRKYSSEDKEKVGLPERPRKPSKKDGKKDLMTGGLADDKTPRDFDREQLLAGTRVELEHTGDERKAREIAMDHLSEDSNYYRKLRRVEGGKAIHHERVDAALHYGRELQNTGEEEDPQAALFRARGHMANQMEAEGYSQQDVNDTWDHAFNATHNRPEKGKSVKALRLKYRNKEIHINPIPPYDPAELDMAYDAEEGITDRERLEGAQALERSNQEKKRQYELRRRGIYHHRAAAIEGEDPAPPVDTDLDRFGGTQSSVHSTIDEARAESRDSADRYNEFGRREGAPPAKIVDNTRPKTKEIHITAHPPVDPIEWDMADDAEDALTETERQAARQALQVANQGRTYRVRRHGRYQGQLSNGEPFEFDHSPEGGVIPHGEHLPTAEAARQRAAESARLYNTHGKRPNTPNAVIVDYTKRPEQKAVNRPRLNQALHGAETMRQQGFDRTASRLHSGNETIQQMYDAGEQQDVVDTVRAYGRRQPEKGKAIKSLRLKYRQKAQLRGEGLNHRLRREEVAAQDRWAVAAGDETVADERVSQLAGEAVAARRRRAEVEAYERREDIPTDLRPAPEGHASATRRGREYDDAAARAARGEQPQRTSRTWNQMNEGKSAKAIRHDRADEMTQHSRQLAQQGVNPRSATRLGRIRVSEDMLEEEVDLDDIEDTLAHHGRSTSRAGVEKGKAIRPPRYVNRTRKPYWWEQNEIPPQPESAYKPPSRTGGVPPAPVPLSSRSVVRPRKYAGVSTQLQHGRDHEYVPPSHIRPRRISDQNEAPMQPEENFQSDRRRPATRRAYRPTPYQNEIPMQDGPVKKLTGQRMKARSMDDYILPENQPDLGETPVRIEDDEDIPTPQGTTFSNQRRYYAGGSIAHEGTWTRTDNPNHLIERNTSHQLRKGRRGKPGPPPEEQEPGKTKAIDKIVADRALHRASQAVTEGRPEDAGHLIWGEVLNSGIGGELHPDDRRDTWRAARDAHYGTDQKSEQQSVQKSKKSLQDLRARYKQPEDAKGRLRRIKHSKEGSCVVCLDLKQVPLAEQAASEAGIGFFRIGQAEGLEKVRLTGDNTKTDDIAKRFGRPVDRYGKPMKGDL